jgi:hypothetical protein
MPLQKVIKATNGRAPVISPQYTGLSDTGRAKSTDVPAVRASNQRQNIFAHGQPPGKTSVVK